jgi:hypothetical protein
MHINILIQAWNKYMPEGNVESMMGNGLIAYFGTAAMVATYTHILK